MKLVIVVGQLAMGGAERVLYLLLSNLPPAVQPTVVVFSYREADPNVGPITELGVPIVGLPRRWSTARRVAEAVRLARRLKPDVVLSHSFYTNAVAQVMGMAAGSRAVGAIRGELVQERASVGALLRRVNTRWPRYQITNNARAVKQVRTHTRWPFRPAQVSVVPQGVASVPDTPPTYPASDNAPLVLGVGSLSRRKRWDILVRAAADLVSSGRSVRVVIAGPGPLRSELTDLASALGVADHVELPGMVDRPDGLLEAASVVVLTSDREGLPNIILEAMAAARPVVATDSGDVRALLESSGAGLVVERGDHRAVAERIAYLLDQPDIAREMGLAGWRTATDRFTPERFVAETLERLTSAR